MKAKYEKPFIKKLHTGVMNKFGTSSNVSFRKVRKDIAGVPIDDLVKNYGSPLFVFSENALRTQYRKLSQAFTTRYPKVQFSWSYKTNYLGAICRILHQEGEIAEVVSDFEYEKARNLGIEGKDIIYNGPYKPYDSLVIAAREGASINIDNYDEIYDLEKVADELDMTIDVGIRLNMDTKIYPLWTRFGFNLESGDAMSAARRIKAGNKLNIVRIHTHIGTYILDPNAYRLATAKIMKFGNELKRELKFSISEIDLGGGFPSMSRLKGVYLPPEVAIQPIDKYAEAICSEILKHVEGSDFPTLILETGRHLVDEAGYLISTVTGSKRLPTNTKTYIIDAGVNFLYTSTWYKFHLEIDQETSGMSEPAVLYGPLCMNIDVVDEFTYLPPLARGTRVIISPVGAYNVSQWMQFIRYRPNVVLVGENGETDIIRHAEELDDIIRKEEIPERLK